MSGREPGTISNPGPGNAAPSANGAAPAVRVRGVRKTFGKGAAAVPALRDDPHLAPALHLQCCGDSGRDRRSVAEQAVDPGNLPRGFGIGRREHLQATGGVGRDQLVAGRVHGRVDRVTRAERFPAVHPLLWIYANLTDAHGRYSFQIRLVDVEKNEVLGRGEPPPIDIPGPLQTTELSAQLRNVALPRAGTYEFQLLANDHLTATKAIRASLVRPASGAKRPDPAPDTDNPS